MCLTKILSIWWASLGSWLTNYRWYPQWVVRHGLQPFWFMPTLHFLHFPRESGPHLHPRNPWWNRQKTDVPHCSFWYILFWLFFNLFLSILVPWFCPLGWFWFATVINGLIVHIFLWPPLKNYRRSSPPRWNDYAKKQLYSYFIVALDCFKNINQGRCMLVCSKLRFNF